MESPKSYCTAKPTPWSYNHETRCPNWVAWHLTSEKAQGQLKRISSKAFREDPDVTSPRATLSDYRGSGYDRGHMCPVGDNKWDKQAMYETFLLTNICLRTRHLTQAFGMRLRYSVAIGHVGTVMSISSAALYIQGRSISR